MRQYFFIFSLIFLSFGYLFCEEAITPEKSADGAKTEATKTNESGDEKLEKEDEEVVTTADKVFLCVKGYNGPSFLGWCKDGSYYGPIHFGNIGFVKSDSFYGAIQVGVVTEVGEDFYGVAQIGVASLANNFKGGAQINLISGAKDFSGFIQIGGILSGSMSSFKGFLQFGGLSSLTGVFRGFMQISSIYSNADHFMGGFQIGAISFIGLGIKNEEGKDNKDNGFYGAFQIGAILSASSTFKGVSQISTVNYSENHFGGQIGVYNHSKKIRGFQIGVVNYAKELYGIQIGLINIAKNGFLPFMPIINAGW